MTRGEFPTEPVKSGLRCPACEGAGIVGEFRADLGFCDSTCTRCEGAGSLYPKTDMEEVEILIDLWLLAGQQRAQAHRAESDAHQAIWSTTRLLEVDEKEVRRIYGEKVTEAKRKGVF